MPADKSAKKNTVTPRRAGRDAAPDASSAAVADVLASLRRLGSERTRDEMGSRYGVTGPTADTAFGVSMADMKRIAKRHFPDHALALALWKSGIYEARMVASMIDDPALVTSAQMDRWCRDFDNWAICDTVCFKLFDQSSHALARVPVWAAKKPEFIRRGGFALLACIALHNKSLPDSSFLNLLPLIEQGAQDDRNFVKKGVSWALRAVGRRNASLRSAAKLLAHRLADSPDAAPRWVGKDVLKDLK